MRSVFEVASVRVLDDEFAYIPAQLRDAIAERVTAAVLDEVERDGQASRWDAYDELGNALCSWCGSMLGPKLSSLHPQYGVFCTCTEPRDEEDVA